MNITVLNGNPQSGGLDEYLAELETRLGKSGHAVTTFRLRDMDIKYCTGCWDCWVKTPGLCRTKDDSHEVCRRYIHSDLVIFSSPVIMGFISAVLKKTTDRLIPLIHPYITLVNNECHHRARYDSYPKIAAILEKGDGDDEDIAIISEIYRRNAINLKSALAFVRLTDRSPEETANAINDI